MWRDMITFEGLWVLNLKLPVEIISYQALGLRRWKMWEVFIKFNNFLRAWVLN